MELTMELPKWVNIQTLVLISYMTLAVIQYVKLAIPDKLIPVASLLVAIGLAILFEFAEVNVYMKLILYGIFATASADIIYQFLGTGTSPKFSLPSKTQLANGGNKPEIPKKEVK